MLSQLIDLIVNILVVVFIIIVSNLFLKKRIREYKTTENFLDNQFPNKIHHPQVTNTVNNNEYNDLINFIYSDSSLFSDNDPINDRLASAKQHNDNEEVKNMLIREKILKEPESDMPYNDQVKPNSFMNNNYLNNANNEIKVQTPEYLEMNKKDSELLNDKNFDFPNGFDMNELSLNSQFEMLV